jgi:hypothetical protein
MNETCGNIGLAVIESHSPPKVALAMGKLERFVCIQVEPIPANACIDGIQ